MADSTRRFGLTVLNSPTDQLDLSNYKFSDADRLLLDRLLRVTIEDHVHTGASISVNAPAAPTLRVLPTGGAIPPNVTVHYRYSIVDTRGQETIASATTALNTPVPATAPGYAPRLSQESGYMEAGEYVYAVSACTRDTSLETLVGPTTSGTLTTYAGWRLDLPPLPSGGEFFNVYRKAPRDAQLVHLVTLAPDARYLVDYGDLTPNRLRFAPVANTTNRTNSIEIELPASVVPDGSWTWKLFRTYDPTNWDNSLLDWNGPDAYYVDDGRASRPGFPPATTAAVGGAPKINLATETTGMPPELVAGGATRNVNFNADFVQVGVGTWQWICEYAYAELVSMRATVSRINPPTVQDCQLGIDLKRPGIAVWMPIVHNFTWDPIVSVVRVGETIGESVSLSDAFAGDVVLHGLRRGDALRLQTHQTGYESTTVPHDLTLTATMRVHNGLSNQTYQWETS